MKSIIGAFVIVVCASILAYLSPSRVRVANKRLEPYKKTLPTKTPEKQSRKRASGIIFTCEDEESFTIYVDIVTLEFAGFDRIKYVGFCSYSFYNLSEEFAKAKILLREAFDNYAYCTINNTHCKHYINKIKNLEPHDPAYIEENRLWVRFALASNKNKIIN